MCGIAGILNLAHGAPVTGAELEKAGHRFYKNADTEIIVHLYEEHSLRFPEPLNGQFAIGLWDTKAHRLVLARDRAGILSLFYSRDGGRLRS